MKSWSGRSYRMNVDCSVKTLSLKKNHFDSLKYCSCCWENSETLLRHYWDMLSHCWDFNYYVFENHIHNFKSGNTFPDRSFKNIPDQLLFPVRSKSFNLSFQEYLTKVSEVFTYQQVHNSIIFEKQKKVSTMKLIYETIFVKFSWPIKVR